MSDWKSVLKEDPTEWLLEKDNPSVRYFTLTEVLNKTMNDRETREAKDEIMKVGVIPRILAKQNSEGYWEEPHTGSIQRNTKGQSGNSLFWQSSGQMQMMNASRRPANSFWQPRKIGKAVVLAYGPVPRQERADIAGSYRA